VSDNDKFKIATEYWQEKPQQFSDTYRFSLNPVRLAAKMFLDKRTAEVKGVLELEPSLVVADIGCGSGETVDWVAERSKFVHGFDISEKMVAIARASVKAKNVSFQVSDCNPIPLPDASADRVMCLGVLDYVVDPTAFCRELSRVSKPGGLVIVTAPKSPSLFEFLRWSTKFRSGISGMPPIVSVLNRSEMEDMLRKCSLQTVKLSSIWTTMWIATARKVA
jgi:ubiquinone/menaquinone biosynthesis C-methylase UbiE